MLEISDELTDQLARDLVQNGGVATLNLPLELSNIHKRAFQVATQAMDIANSEEGSKKVPIIEPHANSATVTGYHSAGGDNALSRYNVYREGFIFSNGELFDVPLKNVGSSQNNLEDGNSFEHAMVDMQNSLCQIIAKGALKGIARILDIDEDWFGETYGPMDSSSQWHIKRYAEPSIEEKNTISNEECKDGDAPALSTEVEWLPVHTDPSLISVIIHDAEGVNKNAMGLQCQAPQTKEESGEKKERVWKEVGYHGHAVATIFCGSVMSYITGGLLQSAKHRVVYNNATGGTPSKDGKQFRQAATLFLRPQGESVLTVPPSDILNERTVKIRRNCKFDDWLSRVSRNYQGKQSKKHKKTKNKVKDTKEQTNNVNPMYWADQYTELTLHGSDPTLVGKEKYLGGELCELNNHIYSIPGFAKRILDFDLTKDPPKLELIGPELNGEFKWLRGIPVGGVIYGIPCHSGSVLKINALTNKVDLLEWDESLPGACPHDQKWKYHGAAVSDHDGFIYCIPQAAERVMKIDPRTDNISFLGPAFPGVNKWYGGLLLNDGAIYGICQNATGILRIDPKTQQCTLHGDFPEGNYKWHGAVRHSDGNLYCIPATATQVLKIEPGLQPKLTLLGENIRTGEHRKDGKYKFLGGASDGNHSVYFFPSDADYVCQVNTNTGEVREVGPNLRNLEKMRNNKWQNGFTDETGTIYGIPLKGETILRIRPQENSGTPDVQCIGGPYVGLNKWEGGVSTGNGDMYCMPLNSNFSLRIRPLTKKDVKVEESDAEFKYTAGQATLRSSMHTIRSTKKSKKRVADSRPNVGGVLPDKIRTKDIISFDLEMFNLRSEVTRMLKQLDPLIIGDFRSDEYELEHFAVPRDSLIPSKKRSIQGIGEKAQNLLTNFVNEDEQFLATFDHFLRKCILPYLKSRLASCGAVDGSKPLNFYYQRPPTLRIQPGPSTKQVRAHSDQQYGHQDGELNFWLPLSDPKITKTDIWSESAPNKEDYKPLGAQLGEVVAFHGSTCKHFVPANESKFTRVSLDFRVGCELYFDPNWKMPGTVSDHVRAQYTL